MTERLCQALLFLFFPCVIFARGYTLTDHSRIRELSTFTVTGAIDLRAEKDPAARAVFRTLNHEGGMSVRVLELMGRDSHDGKDGLWLYVLTMSPMWVEGGEWIGKRARFLIFLPDDMSVFDFEE